MRDFRGPVPLTDADYAAVRRNVLAKLETQRARPRFSAAFRLAFATIVVTFAALITPRPSAPIPMTVIRAEIETVMTPTPVTKPQSPITIPHSTRHTARSTRPRPVVPPRAPAPPIRLEILTSDPDVRIIWIANQTVSTEEPS